MNMINDHKCGWDIAATAQETKKIKKVITTSLGQPLWSRHLRLSSPSAEIGQILPHSGCQCAARPTHEAYQTITLPCEISPNWKNLLEYQMIIHPCVE